MTSITFHGGAGEVTGANILIDFGKIQALVDCGLHQGEEYSADKKNEVPFAYDTTVVPFLFITHAHADHIGRVPLIVKSGFKGVIYSTPETKALSEIVLQDAIHIMRDQEQRDGTKPLYEQADFEHALALWKTVRFHEDVQIGDGVVVHYTPVGHILGAGAVHFKRGGKELVCSGDIGNSPDVLLPAPESIKGADYVVMESVYGDRLHDDRDVRHDILARLITEASDEGRTLLIPCFAVHRAQSILFEIHNMVHHGKAPALPVYLDSPLAIQTTDIYRNSINLFKPEVQQEGEHLFDFPKLQIIKRGHDSAAIDQTPGPKIIIAGSGMSVGGRVISHERALLSDRKTTLLFVGYQAPGTLGRRIQDGQRKVRIADEWIPIRASVETIHGYSGHADRDGLMAFAESAGDSLKKVFVIMGEPRASQFLAQRIHDFLSKDSDVPLEHETVTIDL